MIAHWMLYVAAVGAFVTVGGLAMERAMRACGLPQRWVWAGALVLGLALPAAARWMPRTPEPVPAVTGTEPRGTRVPLPKVRGSVAPVRPRIDVAALDGPLAAGWTGLSAAAVLVLLGGTIVLERRRRRWRAAEVDGVPVLLSSSTGPAVIGLFRSRIVLPEWVVREAAPEVRALLLEHEREHVRAGDPRLLALGLAAVVLAPWNPAAWYGLRRLRLAVEVDCDARVLARRADVRAYGSLLLEVGRRGTGGRLFAAAFSEPASFLERRIRIMTTPRLRLPWLRASGFGAVALALVAVACEAPTPVQTSPTAMGTRMEPVRTEVSTTTEAVPSGVRISRAAIDAAVRTHYPEVFRAAVRDTSHLLFVISPAGEVEAHERLQMRRPNPAPGERGPNGWSEIRTPMRAEDRERSIMDNVVFSPGQMGPGRVDVLWIRKLDPSQRVTTVDVDTMRVPSGTRLRTPAPGQARGTEITAEQARGYVRRYMPQVAANGTTAEFVWFLADASGEIIRHGDASTSEAINAQVDNLLNVQVFKAEDVNLAGYNVPVVYARLKS